MASFIGRLSEIQALTDTFQEHKVVVIRGFKGIGKSALAREFCKHFQRPFYWIDLRNVTIANEILQTLVRVFLQEAIVLDDPKSLLQLICTNISGRRYHLVIAFDNAEDVVKDADCDLFVEILRSLSNLNNTSTVVTTTVKIPVQNDQIGDFFLQELCFEDSFDLLKSVCPTLTDTKKISAIINLCEGIPLALLLAGGEIGPLDVDEVIYLLSHYRLKVLSSECYPKEEQIEPIYKGFLDRLPKALEEKLTDLNYIPGSFNLEEAISVLDSAEDEAKDIVQTFFDRHLISQISDDRLDIHGIIRDCLKEYFKIKNIKEVRARFCKTFSAILKQIEKKTTTQEYADAICTLNLEYQNFQKLFTDVIYCTEDTYHVFIDLAATTVAGGSIIFTTMATYDLGIQFYENCLKKAIEFKEELDEAKVLTGYGKILTNIKGDCVEAEKKFQEAMDIRKRFPNKRDYFLAFLCQSYGWNQGAQGQFVNAIKILKEAFEVEQELGMHYETLILQTMQSLAIFYNFSGHTEKGEPLQLEVLKRRLHVIETEYHPIIGSIMNNMGVLYERKEDFAKAAEYYRKGLAIKEQTNAPIKAIMISESNVARILLELNQNEEAIELVENGFKRLEDIPGLFTDTRSLLLETLGKAHIKMGNFREAAVALKRAISCRCKGAPNDNSILNLVCLYAESLLALSEYEKAAQEIQKGFRLNETLIINYPTNTNIALAYEKLLEAYFGLKRREDLDRTYEAGRNEFFRLIRVYEEMNNFNKREDLLTRFQRFKTRYLGMLKELTNEIHEESQGTINDTVILITLIGLKFVCLAFFCMCIKSKGKTN
ncbi:uncharacterized protein [Magallana gigas]|uniref:uncharacterized protein isoform X1 n=1 Tax=Magallana gigas TaxID=29159 RepID=UPI00333FB1C3